MIGPNDLFERTERNQLLAREGEGTFKHVA